MFCAPNKNRRLFVDPSKKKNARLKTQKDFDRVFKTGVLVRGKFTNIWACAAKNPAASAIGIIVTRKAWRKATERNFWKRRIKEIFRLRDSAKEKTSDFVVVVKKREKMPAFAEIKNDIQIILKKQGR